jgi:hypothetical protein
MSQPSRYWRYGALGLLASGILLFLLIGWHSLAHMSSPLGPLWVAESLIGLGLITWLYPAITRVALDARDLWKKSKSVALLTFAAIVFFAFALHRFTGPHFYGWDANAWSFFFLALFLGIYLLLKASVALTGAARKR